MKAKLKMGLLLGALTLWSATAMAGMQSWEGSPIRVGNSKYVWDKELSVFGQLPKNTQVVATNKSGRVAGNCGDKAVVFDPEFGVVDIGTLGSAPTHVVGMNDIGVVVGVSSIIFGKSLVSHAFMWTEFHMQDIHKSELWDRDLGNGRFFGGADTRSAPVAINIQGQAVVEVWKGIGARYYLLWDGDTADYLFPKEGPNGLGRERELLVMDILDDGRLVVLKTISPNRHEVYLYDRDTDTSTLMHAITEPLPL